MFFVVYLRRKEKYQQTKRRYAEVLLYSEEYLYR